MRLEIRFLGLTGHSARAQRLDTQTSPRGGESSGQGRAETPAEGVRGVKGALATLFPPLGPAWTCAPGGAAAPAAQLGGHADGHGRLPVPELPCQPHGFRDQAADQQQLQGVVHGPHAGEALLSDGAGHGGVLQGDAPRGGLCAGREHAVTRVATPRLTWARQLLHTPSREEAYNTG